MYLVVALLGASCLLISGSRLEAEQPQGTELKFFLLINAGDFENFVLPDSEDAIGIVRGVGQDVGGDTIALASGFPGGWSGTWAGQSATYITKGGISSTRIYFGGVFPGASPPVLKIGDRGNFYYEYYPVSFDGNLNLVHDSEGGAVAVFVHGIF
jgi:hypothetical protein